MSSETYRYYSLDGAGHLNGGEWFDATSDEDAITQIETKHADAKCEIWQSRRLVAQLSPTIRLAQGRRNPGVNDWTVAARAALVGPNINALGRTEA